MSIKRTELIEYLIKEQGYEEDVAKSLPLEELIDLYDMYHEY